VTDGELAEGRIGSLRWLGARGDSSAVFRALGERARHEISYVLERYPERSYLQTFAESPEGTQRLRGIVEATKRHCPTEWQELFSMAEGAGVPIDDLMLFNLRGDLGPTSTGCTDIAWKAERALLAHNEDGLPIFEGMCFLVTLLIDGEEPVTAFWYPGLLPSNGFVIKGASVLWSMDHLSVAAPAVAPGRHFSARRAQRAASLDESKATFAEISSAGAFAYTVGAVATQSIECFEAGGGRVSTSVRADSDQPYLWHANSMRYLDEVAETPDAESAARSSRLAALSDQLRSPDSGVLLGLLTDSSDWPQLYRSAKSPDPLMTLCSMVCDMTSRSLAIAARGDATTAMSLSDLAEGPGRS
jgi:hypothetical protein